MTEHILDQPIRQFLGQLASKAPTPGGGSVAALSGAMAAGLITMVCDLTIGKSQHADFEAEAQSLREQAEVLRSELEQLAQADVDVFNNLMAAYRLPRTTDADAASRRAAIQKVTRQASEVPLRIARAAVGLLPLCAPLARQGARAAVSDVGVAALLIQSTVPHGAAQCRDQPGGARGSAVCAPDPRPGRGSHDRHRRGGRGRVAAGARSDRELAAWISCGLRRLA